MRPSIESSTFVRTALDVSKRVPPTLSLTTSFEGGAVARTRAFSSASRATLSSESLIKAARSSASARRSLASLA
jgi:hypothetical protein